MSYQSWMWLDLHVFCRTELVRFLFPLGKCQKEQRTLELPSKLWLHLASQRAPWEKIWPVEPPSSILVPTPPLSPNHRTATWASDPSTVRQWQYKTTVCWLEHVWLKKLLFFPFLCHSTSYNIAWFAEKAFWNSTGSCCLTFWPKQGGRETAFPQKGDKQLKQLTLVMLAEVKTWRPNPVDQCVYFFLLNVRVRENQTAFLLLICGSRRTEQMLVWLYVCRVLSHCVTVAPGFTTREYCFTLRLIFFFRSNLRLFVQVVPRARMPT